SDVCSSDLQFREEKRGNRRVAFGDVEVGTNAAAFFAADQNILFEHQFADVLEADGRFVEFPAEFCGELVDEFGNGESFCNVSRQVTSPGEVPDEQCKDLMRIHERTVTVDGADAVAIAIGAPAGVEFSAQQRLPQGLDMRLDRLRVNAAEARVVRAANFIAGDAIAPE